MGPQKAKWSLYWLARHKPYWIVLLTGLLLALSFPPSPLNFFIFIAFIPLFVLLETDVIPGRVPEDKIFRPYKSFFIIFWRIIFLQFIWRKEMRGRKVFTYRRKTISGNAQLFRYSYSIFLVWNALTCYWLMLTALGAGGIGEAIVNATAGFLAITLNPLLMSIPLQMYSRVRWVFHPVIAAACFIIFWITFEYLHFNWDLSWSWLTLGHALSSTPWYIQFAEFTGVLGISAFVLIANLFLYRVYRYWHFRHKWNSRRLVYAFGWLALPALLNLFLLNEDRAVFQSDGSLNVRVIQPNIDPYKKYNFYTAEEQVQHFADMIMSRPLTDMDLVVLPETAIPRPLDRHGITRSRLMQPLWAIVDSFDVAILTGVEEYQTFASAEEAPISASEMYVMRGGQRVLQYYDGYNAATILRQDRQVQTYRKGKLVPMVERMPFLELLGNLKDLNIDLGTGMGGYGLPDSVILLETQDGIPGGMMICYESEYGDYVRQSTLLGARFMAIITNDGWWKQSSGYVQHAWLSALRAIENRREIVRAANTGRSMLVDARGYPRQETNWWEEAVIDGKLKLYSGTTFYARHGDFLGRIASWLTLLIVLLALVLNYLNHRPQPPSEPHAT